MNAFSGRPVTNYALELSLRIQQVQQRRSVAEVVYQSHARWPLPVDKSLTSVGLSISILDSSFNPPTLAHLALARALPPSRAGASRSDDYDSRLLLLSVRNADKAVKAGDASFAQRIEMMILLAHELEEGEASSVSSPAKKRSANVAVAIIDEPTFVRKSTVLRRLLQDRVTAIESSPSAPDDTADSNSSIKLTPSSPGHNDTPARCVNLSFIMGFDTLERFLAPRYYGDSLTEMHTSLNRFFAPPPAGDGSAVVCAWRGNARAAYICPRDNFLNTLNAPAINQPQEDFQVSEIQKRMHETLSLAQTFIEAGSVMFTELTEREMMLSSSEVRTKRSKGNVEWLSMVPARVGNFVERERLYIQH